MQTIKQLLRATFKTPRINSGTVHITQVRKGANKLGQPKIICQAYSTVTSVGKIKTGSPPRYACSCTALTKKNFAGTVSVSCACDYFTYTCEYALNHHGAAEIRYSNGEPPDAKNPTLQPTLCKHLFAFLTDISNGDV